MILGKMPVLPDNIELLVGCCASETSLLLHIRVCVITAFILLGRLLEERAKFSTSSAIKKLAGLQPKTVESW